MRQAIEEGFILDVLANYTTYETYWRIEKAIADDPEYDVAQGAGARSRGSSSLHPHNLAQKAEIIVEHFRAAHAPRRSAGRPRRWSSRRRACTRCATSRRSTRYIARARATPTSQALVAFSGTVDRRRATQFTESSMNGFPEIADGRARSTSDDYQVLIVAEKFQTGFDQPLLHTMYVDKTLAGLARGADALPAQPHPPRQDRHVRPRLPQRGRGHREARSSRTTSAPSPPPTDPNLLYDTRRALDDFDVLREDEVERGGRRAARAPGARSGHGAGVRRARPGGRPLRRARRRGAGRVPRRR